MSTTTTPAEIDWNSVRDKLLESITGIRPATWEELIDAIEATHEDVPMGVIETAVDEGILKKQGEGLDDAYTFQLSANTDDDEPADDEDIHITDDGRRYALAMVERDQWLLYEEGEKQVKAPWKTGNLYNAHWGGQLDPADYPETDFKTAQKWSEMALSAGLPGGKECAPVHPGYILQREVRSPEENITLIDLDDCRDPETGDILSEAMDIIERADSYTEVSMSGAGVHIFVFGHLPEWFPGVRLVEDMHTDEQPADEQPKVEIYQRRRIVITTGDHLDGTPKDVTNGHDFVDELCEEYGGDERTAEEVMADLSSTDDSNTFSGGSSGNRSPYFDVDPATLLDAGSYRRVGTRVQGPQPHHGSSGGTDYQSGGRNFSVENGVWTCYRHGSGGNALHLVAVMEGYIDCDDAGRGCLKSHSDAEFARLCLDARDRYDGFDGKPPYRALLGLAKAEGLAAESANEFDYGLRDLLMSLYEGADTGML